MPGEGRVGALIRAMCMDLFALTENPDPECCKRVFL
jgi:hypothetical protein